MLLVVHSIVNIIAVDETILDKQIAVEKIKSLATKKFISVNMKNVSQFKLPFFGKIILASNNEDKFMRIDSEEIRFWVRKIGIPKIENHNILNDMVSEIPAFLYHLTKLPAVDFTHSRMVLTESELANDTLEAVKQESRSGLYKELMELVTDWFDNNNQDELEFIPQDIKQRWFKSDNSIPINYIRRVIKVEFELKPANFVTKYYPFGEELARTGRPYKFKRIDFNDVMIEKEEKLPF